VVVIAASCIDVCNSEPAVLRAVAPGPERPSAPGPKSRPEAEPGRSSPATLQRLILGLRGEFTIENTGAVRTYVFDYVLDLS
jgi:hypothetical protein